MNAESICDLGDDQFYVQSVTHSSRRYLVGLGTQSCDCADWPRVQLCKHVTAIVHFFGNGDQQMGAVVDMVPETVQPIQESLVGDQSDTSAKSILENVIAISRELLNDGAPLSPETVRNLQMVETHLTAVVHNSHSSESPLLEKDAIPPNQGTWTKTAERMGAKRQRRRPRPTIASSPEPLATECIGGLNCKKPRVKITDPYSGGLSSGRDTAPDAQTAAQNVEACTHTAAANGGLPLSQPLKRGRKCTGTSALSAPPPSAPVTWYTVHALPGTQPAAHNAGAPTSSATVENPPSQPPQPSYVHAGTSSAPPLSTPPRGAPFPPFTLPECTHTPRIIQYILYTGLMPIPPPPNLTNRPTI